ncbi:T9SS type B sorting domain-containing protein [Sediminibacterium roseum]|uniref:T9SS type B sorting domain-containing protein n=1 Tax=Sediminibacterium roseum TaxID=1978412 RepID=A0ABW9ZVN8_9BACT|nr:gliding motility-associated C-terminal domain-containing protein [Sediminibacterium roseum]NCI51205.1 T9SS type B sorting domain-containing protein [Sediminibacterium roseum]
MRFVGKLILVLIALQCIATGLLAQCTTLGQNPNTAFPVCGTTTFTQTNVPMCSSGTVPLNGCPQSSTGAVGPYWYKFTCYAAGTLGFTITPLSTGDEDYDWQLFDITGRNPMDVFTDKSMIVAANWVGTYGPTGASDAGAKLFDCASNPNDRLNAFAKMPTLVQGHEYLLLVSHFTSNEIGYTLSFGGNTGGTASITNPVIPRVKSARAICDGQEMVVKLSARISCKSIAKDGSDFSVTGTVNRTPLSASGYGCSVGFDTDSIILQLDNILPPGTFTVTAKTGSDGNTLEDNCGNALPAGDKATIHFTPPAPVPMDSIVPVVCIKDTLQLVFARPLLCNSIAADGSDFTVTGPAAVTVKSATGICVDGQTASVLVILTKPIRTNGTFTITLRNGSDGNSLVDECGQITPAGSTLAFTTKNITTADFVADVRTGCKSDTVYFSHNAYGGTTQWQWTMDSVAFSTQQNPRVISKAFGAHNIRLSVNNGFCSDTAGTQVIFIDNTVKAAFEVKDSLCPTDTLHFTDKSTANSVAWNWNFGNGVTSTLQAPPAQNYPLRGRQITYTPRLSVRNANNCADTAYKLLTVLASCYIAVPSAFTPNGDGLNDYLYPLNAFKADNLMFRVYNRYGQLIFQTADWTRKWDGRYQGSPQPGGTYVWTLDYINRDNGQRVFLKGTSVLIR